MHHETTRSQQLKPVATARSHLHRTSRCSDGETDIAEGRCDLELSGAPRRLGPKREPPRVLDRDSPADQPCSGYDHTKRPSHATTKSVLGKRAGEEYGNEDRRLVEERHRTRSPLQPRTGRDNTVQRRRTRQQVTRTRGLVASVIRGGPPGIRKPQF